MQKLRHKIVQNNAEGERRIYVSLTKSSDHKEHPFGQVCNQTRLSLVSYSSLVMRCEVKIPQSDTPYITGHAVTSVI